MSKKWLKRTGIVGTVMLPLVIVAFVLVQIGGVSLAIDQYEPDPDADSTSTYDDSADAPPTAEWPHRDFFKPYPMGEEGAHYDDMSESERAMLDAAKAHYDTHGESIAQAWSRGTRARAEYAKLRIAEREAGHQNIADVGVE